MKRKRTHKLPDFTLRGILRLHQFFAIPGSLCDLCLRTRQGKVAAICRQVEQRGNPKAKVSLLVGTDGKPLDIVAPKDVIADIVPEGESQRCLCKKHLEMVTYDAMQRGLVVIRYDKFDFDSEKERGY